MPQATAEARGAIHGRQEAMDAFAQMDAGAISPAEFFAPPDVEALVAAAPAAWRESLDGRRLRR